MGMIASSHPWVPNDDPDDDSLLVVDSEWLGNIDHPGDRDIFLITLKEDEQIRARVESGMFAPLLVISSAKPEVSAKVLAKSSDDGPVGATVDFTAPADGDYLVIVVGKHLSDIGGYYLTIQQP